MDNIIARNELTENDYAGTEDELKQRTKELVLALKLSKADPQNIMKKQDLEQKKAALEQISSQASNTQLTQKDMALNSQPLANNQGLDKLRELMKKLGR